MKKTDVQEQLSKEYRYGFETEVEADTVPKGLNEEIIRLISAKKDEPDFLLDFRLKAFEWWQQQKEPTWANLHYPPIDFQKIRYYSAPKKKPELDSLDDVEPEVLRTFEKLGIPLEEQKRLAGVAVDAVFDSVSVRTTHQDMLSQYGVIFCSFSEAAKKYPELIKKYLGSVVPVKDNFYAGLNS
ncbi:MAG TPA: hypothetical protein VJ904_14730, partial [Tichowtungia sp.]|nr:hypothetical protein [Tichowtungia sp.]